MNNEPMQHYLLAAHEAELVACFRMLSEPAKEVILSIVASQAAPGSRELTTPVKLSVVRKS